MLCTMTNVDRGRKVTRSGTLHGRDLGGEAHRMVVHMKGKSGLKT